MSRIADRFTELQARGETALIPFITAGDPDLETTEMLIPALAAAGADLIELGVPFSDPVAEGPVIEKASERALAAGATLAKIIELVKRVREKVPVPILLMGYANPFLHMGGEKFAAAASEAGVDGVIIPDLPPEEGSEFFARLQASGIDPVLLAAPTTRDQRLGKILDSTRGFLYYVSLRGVTGARTSVASGLEQRVKEIRAHAHVPVCVGFGVSNAAQVEEIGTYADGVVVGSALVRVVERAGPGEPAVEAATKFVSELKAALRRTSR